MQLYVQLSEERKICLPIIKYVLDYCYFYIVKPFFIDAPDNTKTRNEKQRCSETPNRSHNPPQKCPQLILCYCSM